MKSIEAFDLVRNFNGFTAVENLSFSVEKGEIFARARAVMALLMATPSLRSYC